MSWRSIMRAGGLSAAFVCAVVSAEEGRRLYAYQDIVGVWTICDGDTKRVRAGQTATDKECDARLLVRLIEHEDGMLRCLKRELPYKVQVALLSFTYNVGVAAFCRSTLAKKANAGDLKGACNELPHWIFAGNSIRRGLVNRRTREQALCHEGLT